jgi:hypothetical protein
MYTSDKEEVQMTTAAGIKRDAVIQKKKIESITKCLLSAPPIYQIYRNDIAFSVVVVIYFASRLDKNVVL